MYDGGYTEFLQSVHCSLVQPSVPDMVSIFHHIRQIPYGGAGQRDPRMVYEGNLGTCSGKHILLRDLLRAADIKADVVTVLIHFNKGIPLHSSMSAELQSIIAEEEVPDYHHFVRAQVGEQWFDLDATWRDNFADYGFVTNSGWCGAGPTTLAGTILKTFPITEDIAAQKTLLLKGLSADETALRSRFLALLTDWICARPVN